MFQSGLPLSYWGEAVLTAAYIINRLPSTVLNNKCPYVLLYDEPVDYNVLKCFGCLAFAINPTHTSDKFSPRGVPCVFIGYPPTQKGYRLLDLRSMQMFVSRDVTFNETVYPMNVTTPKPYMLPLPTIMPNNSQNTYFDYNFCDTTSPDNDHTDHVHNTTPLLPNQILYLAVKIVPRSLLTVQTINVNKFSLDVPHVYIKTQFGWNPMSPNSSQIPLQTL